MSTIFSTLHQRPGRYLIMWAGTLDASMEFASFPPGTGVACFPSTHAKGAVIVEVEAKAQDRFDRPWAWRVWSCHSVTLLDSASYNGVQHGTTQAARAIQCQLYPRLIDGSGKPTLNSRILFRAVRSIIESIRLAVGLRTSQNWQILHKHLQVQFKAHISSVMLHKCITFVSSRHSI